MIGTGFITGRFQIFHNGHLQYALEAKEKVGFLIVGICNPDSESTDSSPADPFRHRPENNPFTYWERLLMVKGSLLAIGLPEEAFAIVPCPIGKPNLIHNYLPKSATHLTRVYDDWNREKIRILEGQGYKSRILCEASPEDRIRSFRLPIGGIGSSQTLAVEPGKNVRKRLLEDDDWRQFVPAGTAEVIRELDLAAKLKRG